MNIHFESHIAPIAIEQEGASQELFSQLSQLDRTIQGMRVALQDFKSGQQAPVFSSDAHPLEQIAHPSALVMRSLVKRQLQGAIELLESAIINDELAGAIGQEPTDLADWHLRCRGFFSRNSLAELTSSQLLYLSCLIVRGGKIQLSLFELSEDLPALFKAYSEELRKEAGHDAFVKFTFTAAEPHVNGYEAFAQYVNCHKVPLSALKETFSEDQWSRLAPHLCYVDLRNLELPFINKLLKNTTTVHQLFIENDQIQTLPDLPACTTLSCRGCRSLASLPDLPLCKEVDCEGCIAFKSMPNLSRCIRLNCRSCTSLESLPDLPVCTTLICHGCTSLAGLPGLPACRLLRCAGCTLFERLPDLPACARLDCEGCTALVSLPNLPACVRLNCRSCLLLESLPELCDGAEVFSGPNQRTSFFKLDVDVDQFSKNPKELLLELGRKFLLKKLPFPTIYYFQNGQRSEAIDVGGVGRDFISWLIDALFSQGKACSEKLLLDGSGCPLADDQVETRDAYRSLGAVFALCYREGSFFKIGSLFNKKVYDRLVFMPGNDLEQESTEGLVSLYQKFSGSLFPVEIAEFINASSRRGDDIVLSEGALDVIKGLLWYVKDHDEMSRDPKAYLRASGNREALKEEIKAEVLGNKTIRALNFIAMGVKGSLGEEGWQEFCRHEGGTLQERVEGVLSKEKLLSKITWKKSHLVSQAQLEKTQDFMTNWVGRAGVEQLHRLVRVVTSNNALGKDNLTIKVFDRGPGCLPVARSCFFILELSSGYMSQEVFDEKLNWLLAEGLAGTGFQMA